jgi:Sec-independent protein secretion pathway component TatC
VRVGFIVVVPAVLAFLFSISTTGTLPRSSLEPLFDTANAASVARTLSVEYPSRVPGSEGGAQSTRWYEETLRALGLTAEEDTWSEDLADLGTVELHNVVTVVPGRSPETIVVVAHRDNAGTSRSLGDNASGTAALIELARGFAPQDAGPDPEPQRTLVFVSTDAGAYGGAGAERFASSSPLARSAIATVILDGIGGSGPPRIAIAGDRPVSPARAFVRTAAARLADQTGTTPELPSVPTQLVDLGVPFAGGEQGRFLGHGLAAVTLTTRDPEDPSIPAGDPATTLDTRSLGQLGRATEALLSSLDGSVGGAFRTPDSLFLGDRAASGWSVRLMLVLGVVPFALGLVDLVVRGRKRGLLFRPALRALRTRLGVALLAAFLVWCGALGGVFATGAPLPLSPLTGVLTSPAIGGLLLLTFAFLLGWLVARRNLTPLVTPTAAERLAGLAVALGALAVVAVALALTKPYALVFVLPSLYAWLWLPLERSFRRRIAVFVLGLAGPAIALFVLGQELGVSILDAGLYAIGLATVGYVSLWSVLVFLVWAAAAAQVGALAFGRYGPYAGGAEPPPPGPLRRTLRARR